MKKISILIFIFLISIQSNAQLAKDLKKAASKIVAETSNTGLTE